MKAYNPAERHPWRHVTAIAVDDLVEFLRDRRTFFITMLLPMLMYPIVALSSAVGLRTAVREQQQQWMPMPLSLAVTGGGAEEFVHAVEGLESTGPEWPSSLAMPIVEPMDAVRMLDRGEVDFWVDIKEGFEESLVGDGTVRLEARAGGSHPPSQRVRDHLSTVVDRLARRSVFRRLERAGMPATVISPIRMSFLDPPGASAVARRSTPNIVAPILVMLSVLTLTGAFYPAVDAIAGEKERGTIETLLIAPCRPWEIATGKFAAILVVTILTLVSNVLSLSMTAWVADSLAPEHLELFPRMSWAGLLVAGGSFLALSAIGAALSLAVTTASRSTKEAQHSLTPVIVAVSLLSGFAVTPGARPWALSAVPFTGQILVAKDALSTPAASIVSSCLVPLGITVIAAAVVTAALLWLTGVFLVDEEILFRGPDSTEGILRRPGKRWLPTPLLAGMPAVFGLTALWYAQPFSPDDLALAIPFQQAVSLVLPLAIFSWWQRVDTTKTFRLAAPAAARSWVPTVVGSVLLGAGMFVVSAGVLSLLAGGDASDEARDLSARMARLVNENPPWLVWIAAVAMPAVFEELMFRGWTLSGLVGRHPDVFRNIAGIVGQAGLFAVMHLLPERMPSTFVFGLVLGWVAIRSGSILPGMLCHAAHNTMPLAVLWFAPSSIEGLGRSAFIPLIGIAAVVGGGLLLAAGTAREGLRAAEEVSS